MDWGQYPRRSGFRKVVAITDVTIAGLGVRSKAHRSRCGQFAGRVIRLVRKWHEKPDGSEITSAPFRMPPHIFPMTPLLREFKK